MSWIDHKCKPVCLYVSMYCLVPVMLSVVRWETSRIDNDDSRTEQER